MTQKPIKTRAFGDSIALASPSGRMSRAARQRAERRINLELFGSDGLQKTTPPQRSEVESLLAQAAELRDLAKRGQKPRAYLKKAKELEARAAVTRAVILTAARRI